MVRSGRPFWKLAARTFFVPFFAYFLAVQTILMPLARAKASESAAIGILCLTIDQESGGNDGSPSKKHAHDLGCCLTGHRFVLDMPVAILSGVIGVHEPEAIAVGVENRQHQSRAPPASTATPSQSRAPPIPA